MEVYRGYSRRNSKGLMLGDVAVGGGAPVSIQSMTTTVTADHQGSLAQIRRLAEAGCQIIRLAVADASDVEALPMIVDASPIPVVADIQFDYRLAVNAANAGVAGLRINPGNIGAAWKVKELVQAATAHGIPIRIGVNGGSLERDILEKYGGPVAAAMVESAMGHVRILEELYFRDIKLSLKSSHVPIMLEAYRTIAWITDYPLHLGVTETGLPSQGLVRSAIGVGALLSEGIGDTIRVSFTGDPMEEILAAKEILVSLDLVSAGLRIIACPTCGRTQVDLASMVHQAELKLAGIKPKEGKSITVAIMGCPVNGPGEAKEADFGIACGKGSGILFAGGQQEAVLPEEQLIDALVELVESKHG